jgi:hypothetical protein
MIVELVQLRFVGQVSSVIFFLLLLEYCSQVGNSVLLLIN